MARSDGKIETMPDGAATKVLGIDVDGRPVLAPPSFSMDVGAHSFDYAVEDADGRQALRIGATGLVAPALHGDIASGARGRSAGSTTHVVISRRRLPLSHNFDLWSVDLDTGAEVRLTSDADDRYDFADPSIIGTNCFLIRRDRGRQKAFVVPLAGGALAPAFPEDFIVVNGDSFTGAGWDASLVAAFARPRTVIDIGVGGTTLAQQATAFEAVPHLFGGKLVIMEGGWGLDGPDSIAAIQSQLDNLASHFKHWCVVEPSPQEMALGDPARTAYDASVDAVDDAFPGHMVRCLAALQAANDGSANDLADVANGLVPRSLRTDTIHETEAAMDIRTALVAAYFEGNGW